MKCTRCKEPAEVKLRAHNSAFCRACYLLFFERRAAKAIQRHAMFDRSAKILVAISGGKDSLALWEVLAREGYHTVGFHLALGIGAYSQRSIEKCRTFAAQRELALEIRHLDEHGLAIPEIVSHTRRSACSACGTMKRHHFDTAALELGCSVIATGHNLDDEAARLFGNVLHWQIEYLSRQRPVMQPGHPKFVRKVKPFFLLSELETATYSFMRGIDYVVEECPNAQGASQLEYKALLDQLENKSPGSKLSFVQEFTNRASQLFVTSDEDSPRGTCETCGMPSFNAICSYCALEAEVERRRHAS